MKIKTSKKIERICIIGIIILSIVTLICVSILALDKKKNILSINLKSGVNQFKNESRDDSINKSTQGKDIFKTICELDKPMPKISFVKENGTKLNLEDLKGKTVIITFWASWCKHCNNELKHSEEFYDALKKYDNVEFVLVNKLDGIKETKEQALNYLKQNNIPFATVFDENLLVYNKLGIQMVPTTLVIDTEGILKNINVGEIDDVGKLEALIQSS